MFLGVLESAQLLFWKKIIIKMKNMCENFVLKFFTYLL